MDNLGNSCWENNLIQVTAHLKAVDEIFVGHHDDKDINSLLQNKLGKTKEPGYRAIYLIIWNHLRQNPGIPVPLCRLF